MRIARRFIQTAALLAGVCTAALLFSAGAATAAPAVQTSHTIAVHPNDAIWD